MLKFFRHFRLSFVLFLTITMLVSCGGYSVNSPLSRAEKRIYRLDSLVIEAMPSLSNNAIKRDIEKELGQGWRFWLFGHRPLEVIVQIHDVNAPSSQLQRVFGAQSSMTTRIIIKDKQTDAILDDFTRVTKGGYEGLTLSASGQESERSAQRTLAETFVQEFRVMFYFGLD